MSMEYFNLKNSLAFILESGLTLIWTKAGLSLIVYKLIGIATTTTLSPGLKLGPFREYGPFLLLLACPKNVGSKKLFSSNFL